MTRGDRRAVVGYAITDWAHPGRFQPSNESTRTPGRPLLTTILTTSGLGVPPSAGVRRRSICRLTCAGVLRRTARDVLPTSEGLRGRRFKSCQPHNAGQGPFSRDPERPLTASMRRLTTIRTAILAEGTPCLKRPGLAEAGAELRRRPERRRQRHAVDPGGPNPRWGEQASLPGGDHPGARRWRGPFDSRATRLR